MSFIKKRSMITITDEDKRITKIYLKMIQGTLTKYAELNKEGAARDLQCINSTIEFLDNCGNETFKK